MDSSARSAVRSVAYWERCGWPETTATLPLAREHDHVRHFEELRKCRQDCQHRPSASGQPSGSFSQPVRAAVVPRRKWPRAKRAGASWWVSAMWRREAEAPGIGAINVIGISCILCDRADRIEPTSEFWPWIQVS